MLCKYFFKIVLVLLVSSTIFSLELKMVPFQQRRMNMRILKSWNNFQTSTIEQCLQYRKDFGLPQMSVNLYQYQKGQVLAVLHETFQQLLILIKENFALDGGKKNYLVKILTELHQQLQYLEGFIELETKQRNGTVGSENLRLQIKMYFTRICDYLETQEYSSCAWTIVQVEINRCLFFVFRLTGRLSRRNRALNSVAPELPTVLKSMSRWSNSNSFRCNHFFYHKVT
ncbi:LOW QUALITY PROTEIN: interferon epsilon [Ochotona princeps]|uniref:LOW QUALITY PROTEIN: interferon epsilon n=1 Tax=Ochotona princeps TaxID=9978 RepID=UPI0027151FD3|nr:LOW QUALITY PROTEIN: interferon epsilon [Ochotona princeps]